METWFQTMDQTRATGFVDNILRDENGSWVYLLHVGIVPWSYLYTRWMLREKDHCPRLHSL